MNFGGWFCCSDRMPLFGKKKFDEKITKKYDFHKVLGT